MLRDGSWRGRRCFVIGGGPSLSGFDFGRLSGELTLGVNMAFLRGAVATLVGDLSLIRTLSADPRWASYGGEKFWLNAELRHGAPEFPGVTVLRESLRGGLPAWSRSLSDGLWRRTNTGASALNLAEVLGADPIFLLGFDMAGGNWHDEYGKKQPPHATAFAQYACDFEENATQIRAKVVNLNPASRLRCFEFSTLEEVLGDAAVRQLPHAALRAPGDPAGRIP